MYYRVSTKNGEMVVEEMEQTPRELLGHQEILRLQVEKAMRRRGVQNPETFEKTQDDSAIAA